MDLARAAWPEIGERPTVIVPVGSIEQHGPHLPLDTDSVIAVAVSRAVSARLGGSLVAPAIVYGSSGEHQSFAGTSSVGTDVLASVLVELVRSISTWSGRILFVNAHGGNLTAIRSALTQLIEEGHDVAWVPCATEEVDLHAGLTETSLMLHLAPASVRLDHAVPGDTRPLREILPMLMTGGVAAVSANGVLGDPTGADADHGIGVLDQMVEQTVMAVERGVVSADGRLVVPEVP